MEQISDTGARSEADSEGNMSQPGAASSDPNRGCTKATAKTPLVSRILSRLFGIQSADGRRPAQEKAEDSAAASSMNTTTLRVAAETHDGSPQTLSTAAVEAGGDASENDDDRTGRSLDAVRENVRGILGGGCKLSPEIDKALDDAASNDELRAAVDLFMAQIEGLPGPTVLASDASNKSDDEDDDDAISVFLSTQEEKQEQKIVELRRVPVVGEQQILTGEFAEWQVFSVLCAEAAELVEKLQNDKSPVIILYRSHLVDDHGSALTKWFDAMPSVYAFVLADKEKKDKHRAARIHSLDRSKNGRTTVILATPTQALEPTLLEVVDIEMETPAMSADLVSKIYATCLSDKVALPREEWVRQLIPTDLFLVDREFPCTIASKLKERVLLRRGRSGSAKGIVALSDLYGLGPAKQWALHTIADIKAAAVGDLAWDDIDNGALIDGPPGVGKTALVRAIAADSGVPVHATTATSWMGAGSLDDILQAMNADFEIARKSAPSILFIDEIDGIGNRENGAGGRSGDQWITWTVNHLLTLIDGFSRKQKIIVIGATNHAGNVDPALRRAGRLDRTITVALPKENDRRAIFRTYLGRIQHTVSAESVDNLGRISAGLSGADIEMYVREAKGRARRKRRLVEVNDLIECINGMPEDKNEETITPSAQENAAWRMAGRAVLAHVYGIGEILQLSVYPRSDGKVGSTAVAKIDRPLKDREHFRVAMAVELAERAVEEHRFGSGRGTDASGHVFDVCAKIAQTMVKKWRLSDDGPYLTDGFGYSREVDEKVDEEMKSAYALALSTIKRHDRVVKEVANLLLAQSEMSGAEFYGIVNSDKDLGAAHRFIQQITS